MPERKKFNRFKRTQVVKLGKGLQLTDYNDLMNYVAQPGVVLPDTFEECAERQM